MTSEPHSGVPASHLSRLRLHTRPSMGMLDNGRNSRRDWRASHVRTDVRLRIACPVTMRSLPVPAMPDLPPRTGPLAGLLVADFSRVLAGPNATMLLAD